MALLCVLSNLPTSQILTKTAAKMNRIAFVWYSVCASAGYLTASKRVQQEKLQR